MPSNQANRPGACTPAAEQPGFADALSSSWQRRMSALLSLPQPGVMIRPFPYGRFPASRIAWQAGSPPYQAAGWKPALRSGRLEARPTKRQAHAFLRATNKPWAILPEWARSRRKFISPPSDSISARSKPMIRRAS